MESVTIIISDIILVLNLFSPWETVLFVLSSYVLSYMYNLTILPFLRLVFTKEVINEPYL